MGIAVTLTAATPQGGASPHSKYSPAAYQARHHAIATRSPIATPPGLPTSGSLVPAPGPGSRIATREDTNTSQFVVDGVPVILRRLTGTDVVAANVYLIGGTREAPAGKAGIEPLLLEASERGTRRFPKEALRRRMAMLGTQIVIDPDPDWTTIGIRATVGTFDSTWTVLAERLMRPTLDSSEVELVRQQFLSGVAQREDSPDALVSHLADSIAFLGSHYAIDPVGDLASLQSITLADLRAYHARAFVKSRMLVVVVGNVSRARVENLVRTTLARLPAGSYAWQAPREGLASPGPADIVYAQRTLPTNYIQGYFGGPPATSADYQALRVATAILSGRLFEEIRARRNLTYAVHAPFVERAVSAGGLYVTTAQPDTTLALMRVEIDQLQRRAIVAEALERIVQQFITEYFLDNETNADQADFLAQAYLFRGDWKAADRFVDELRDVTPQDIQRVAKTYMKNVRFAYVGDSTRLRRSRVRQF